MGQRIRSVSPGYHLMSRYVWTCVISMAIIDIPSTESIGFTYVLDVPPLEPGLEFALEGAKKATQHAEKTSDDIQDLQLVVRQTNKKVRMRACVLCV
eukprot:scaffold60907_cov28-Tisochrysis_lutea.AAC.1